MVTFQNQSGFAPLVVVVIIGVLGLGSVATVTAADNAKPGDILYPVDTGFENLRLNLTTSPETQVELRTQFAAERVAEVEAALQERGVEAPGLDIALNNLTTHKVAIASLVTQRQELKAKAKVIEDLFEQKEKELEAAFKAAKRELKVRRADLKAQLAQAIADGNTARADSLRAQIAQIEAQLDALEAQEEAVEEVLEVEEENLEAQFEIEEEALEEKEEALEEEQERIEEREEEKGNGDDGEDNDKKEDEENEREEED